MAKIWTSKEKDAQLTELTDNLIALNIFSEEYIVGIVIDRSEAEQLALGIAEWVGLPLFFNTEEE
jgi:hypothetical protein|tara:strand:- start:7646 stop:7840 length:195 start_codon:yes stop_codon:yes gene_type:complete